jgi:hypothetical protein
MSPLTRKNNCFSSLKDTHDKVARPPCNGQKVRFENEEAEIIRISPFLIIKTKDRIVCGALHHRIEYLAA